MSLIACADDYGFVTAIRRVPPTALPEQVREEAEEMTQRAAEDAGDHPEDVQRERYNS